LSFASWAYSIGLAGVVMALFAGSNLWGQDEPPAKKDPAPAATGKDKKVVQEKTVSRFKGAKPDIHGKLIRVEGAQRYIAVNVTQKIGQQNLSALANIANLRQQLIGNHDRNSILSIQLEIAKNQANAITFYDETQKVELQLTDDLKVRTLVLPIEYDDKGKPRRLTEKEKKDLRGPDPTLPGYTSDFDSLKPDQIVEIYLDKSKNAKSKARNKDESTPPTKPTATMIVICAEPVK
jgi:hypothetical protein